jgi:ankyrin repeat protein
MRLRRLTTVLVCILAPAGMLGCGRTPTRADADKAIEAGDAAALERALKGDADLAMPKELNRMLIAASEVGEAETVVLLLSRGADANAKGANGVTPLHSAAKHDFRAIAERLIAAGADMDARDAHGRTPFSYARRRGSLDVMFLLKRKGAPNAEVSLPPVGMRSYDFFGSFLPGRGWVFPKVRLDNDTVSFLTAAWNGDAAKLTELLGKGVRVDVKDFNQYQAIHFAAIHGNTDLVELLIARGADVNAKDSAGCTPLHLAADRDHRGLMALLIAKGADVNARSERGRTPLGMAAVRNYGEAAELLIEKGADVLAEDEDGESALDTAVDYRYDKTIEVLIRHGAGEDWLRKGAFPTPETPTDQDNQTLQDESP